MKSNGKLEIDEFIGHLQLVAFLTRQYLERRFIEEATEKPLSHVHMNLLRILDTRPGETVGDIAKYMKVSYPAATKTIDKLVRLGLLKRREDPQDRRIAHLHLTTSGKKMVDKYDHLKKQEIIKILDNISPEDALNLNRQLHDLSEAIVGLAPISKSVCMQCGAYSPDACHANSDAKSCGFLTALNSK